MDLGLTNKVVVIAGGSKGLGAAAARRFADEGAHLVLAARNGEALAALASELERGRNIRALPCAVDLTAPDGADRMIAAAMAAFDRVDVLVSSVGAAQGGIFWEIPDRVWDDAISLKLLANMRNMRAAVRAMRPRKSGRIVCVVGSAGRQPPARTIPGAAANAALLAVVRGLAEEVGKDGIVVNAINPGPVRTERWATLAANLSRLQGRSVAEFERDYIAQIPLGRIAEPDEIARSILFLASEACGNVTGTSITADGGWTKALA